MKVAAFVGGHSFDRAAYLDFLGALPAEVTLLEHPEALAWLDADRLGAFDASLHYDMPGVRPEPSAPPASAVAAINALTDAGHGFVVLHHAIGAWPAWDGWAELVGGRYHYRPGWLRGTAWPDSGYRFDVTEHLSTVDSSHPVVAGLEAGLDLVDETYLCPVFEADVTPLLRTNAPIDDSVHWSTVEAMAGRMFSRADGRWSHPPGSSLAAWAREVRASRLVYIQPGDGPSTYANPGYRRLVANALAWVSGQTD